MTLQLNTQLLGDGLALLSNIDQSSIKAVFLDPQYRGVLDKLSYGNEGARQKERSSLPQMSDNTIKSFIHKINYILKPSGHLFLWVDKFHLCTGLREWITPVGPLAIVDMVTWDKGRIGMGYRTRRRSEHCLIVQKAPYKAKGCWLDHDIPDVWGEQLQRDAGPPGCHQKPIGLTMRLIRAVTDPGDLVVDPAAGTFSTLHACELTNRRFYGCDLARGSERLK